MTAVPTAKRRRSDGFENGALLEYVGKLYLSSRTADVYFLCGPDNGSAVRVPAHKNLLAAGSDVFDAMFYGSLKEKGDVKVTDVSAAAFEEFLQFFYKGQVQLSAQHISEVMYLGHKYNVVKCFDVCVQFLKSTLTNGNVCFSISLAILYNQNELQKFCKKRIIANTDAVFKSSDFLKCDKEVLGHILRMNLFSCSEVTVFEACMSWVKAKSGENVVNKELIQEHLGDLFYEIRFSSMAVGDFIELSLSHDYAFSPDEYKDIIQTFSPSGHIPRLFNEKPRQIQWNKDAIVRCSRVSPNGKDGWVTLLNVHTTILSINEPFLLGGFYCAKVSVLRGKINHDLKSDLPIDITIFEASDLKNVDKKFARILSNVKGSLTSTSERLISLPEPVLIRPGFFYHIHVKLSPENHRYYYKELMTKVELVHKIYNTSLILKFHNDEKFMKADVFINPIMALEFNRIL